MRKMKLGFQKWDIAVIAGVAALAVLVLALFLPRDHGDTACAEIYQDGKLVRTVSLAEDQEFTVTGKFTNTVAVRNGKIGVIESDCPGEDCVNCGWIEVSGRSIVCLPNGLEIRVVAEKNDVDFVVG